MNIFIRLLYSILIAAAVITFVVEAIFTFYPGPKAPEYMPQGVTKSYIADSPAGEAYQRQYDKLNEQYQADMKEYQRTVSIVLVFVAAAVVIVGLWVHKRSDIIGEGLQLGGIGTSIYAVGMATVADDRVMRFLAVTLFLASVITVVYIRFNEKPSKPTPKKKVA